jgi:hypothetical protein
MCMLARCLRQLVSTIRPSGFACRHGGSAAFQHFSKSLHTREAEMLTSGGVSRSVLTCEASLPVVFLVAVYFCCAVELFEEDDSGE